MQTNYGEEEMKKKILENKNREKFLRNATSYSNKYRSLQSPIKEYKEQAYRPESAYQKKLKQTEINSPL